MTDPTVARRVEASWGVHFMDDELEYEQDRDMEIECADPDDDRRACHCPYCYCAADTDIEGSICASCRSGAHQG
jgi:hypothetical protein